jgi:hypothetical protein
VVTEYQRRMDKALKVADLHRIPVELVLHRDMLHNWRRRTKRLGRGLIRALQDPVDKDRALAINAALRRLHTGRLHP